MGLLPLPQFHSNSPELAAETEVMLARWHVQWGADDDGFARRLCQVDALELYVAIVDAILTQYDHSQALRDDFPEF